MDTAAGRAALRALERNIIDYVRLFAALPGATWHEEPGFVRLHTPDVPNPFFNSVLRARCAPAAAAALVARMVDLYQADCLPLMWWLDADSPPGLSQVLRQQRFFLEASPALACPLAHLPAQEPPRPGRRVTRVQTPADLRHWIQINTAPYHFLDYVNDAFYACYSAHGFAPAHPLRHYLAWHDDTPIGCATLFLAGGVAAIYSVAVLAQQRRQGVGRGLLLALLHEARAAGYATAALSSTPDGYGVYQRLGFMPVGTTSLYVRES